MNVMKCTIVPGVCLLCMMIFISSEVKAQTDTIVHFMDTVVVSAKRNTSYVKGNVNETLRWDMQMMHELPKILGNADPMHYSQLLPGIQTCSEYNSGLYIQGCDNAHNLVAIEGVPIYNASHLLGFFSIFNASHFSQMYLSRTAKDASVSNHLGGVVDMQLPDTCVSRMHGDISIGPISSQGTIRIPTSKKSSLSVSLRTAYLNLLYKKWLKIDDNQMKYGFSDYNVTYLYTPNEKNILRTDFYYGNDNVDFDEVSYMASSSLDWMNMKASVEWIRKLTGASTLEQQLYYTGYKNTFKLSQESLNFKLPSSIYDIGYKLMFRNHSLNIGTDIIHHNITPQNPELTGSYNMLSSQNNDQKTWEYALFADYNTLLSSKWAMKSGVRFTYYHCNGKDFFSANPQLGVTYTTSRYGNVGINLHLQHQYLFQTGFSSLGLPTEFWFSSDKRNKPQYSTGGSITYDIPLDNGNWHFYVEGYYKMLYNQVEYKGSIFDFLNSSYNLDNSLLKGKGQNFGVNFMLSKKTGKLTGWMSYALGRAYREFRNEGYDKRYPANHERIHELNVAATYQLSSKWSFGGTAVYASGTPYTAPKYIYLLANHIVSEYGEHNAERLNPYFRLDLSCNYTFWKKHGKEMGLNMSLYNATCNPNELYYRLSIDGKTDTYRYKPVRFLLRILPSINLYAKF